MVNDHSTDVVNLVHGPNLSAHCKNSTIKGTHLKIKIPTHKLKNCEKILHVEVLTSCLERRKTNLSLAKSSRYMLVLSKSFAQREIKPFHFSKNDPLNYSIG